MKLHGTRSMYVSGCKCPRCTAANAAYQKEHRGKVKAVQMNFQAIIAERIPNGMAWHLKDKNHETATQTR